MKTRILALFCALMLIAVLPGCAGKTDNSGSSLPAAGADGIAAGADIGTETAGQMPAIVDTMEYSLYQNIFFSDRKAEYDGKDTEKKGTFATLYDAFNDVTRYYVWGYNDQTKCCDWQWELKPDDLSDLPTNGSLIRVSGVYESNDAALDKFWIIHPQITVETPFAARDVDIDMQAMDNTLERVQSINIVRKAETFEGKTVCGYGRILGVDTLQDPYYDNSWTLSISGDFNLPAIGTVVLVSGTIHDGGIVNCEILPNTQY